MSHVMEEFANEVRMQERKDAAIEFAFRMLDEGDLSLERISRLSGLSIEEVKALQAGRSA